MCIYSRSLDTEIKRRESGSWVRGSGLGVRGSGWRWVLGFGSVLGWRGSRQTERTNPKAKASKKKNRILENSEKSSLVCWLYLLFQ